MNPTLLPMETKLLTFKSLSSFADVKALCGTSKEFYDIWRSNAYGICEAVSKNVLGPLYDDAYELLTRHGLLKLQSEIEGRLFIWRDKDLEYLASDPLVFTDGSGVMSRGKAIGVLEAQMLMSHRRTITKWRKDCIDTMLTYFNEENSSVSFASPIKTPRFPEDVMEINGVQIEIPPSHLIDNRGFWMDLSQIQSPSDLSPEDCTRLDRAFYRLWGLMLQCAREVSDYLVHENPEPFLEYKRRAADLRDLYMVARYTKDITGFLPELGRCEIGRAFRRSGYSRVRFEQWIRSMCFDQICHTGEVNRILLRYLPKSGVDTQEPEEEHPKYEVRLVGQR